VSSVLLVDASSDLQAVYGNAGTTTRLLASGRAVGEGKMRKEERRVKEVSSSWNSLSQA